MLLSWWCSLGQRKGHLPAGEYIIRNRLIPILTPLSSRWTVPLTVPSGQIGSAWEWYDWIRLEKETKRNRFFCFYFWSWIFDKSSKFWAASCTNESNLLLDWITVYMCSNIQWSFPPNHTPKMRKRHQLFFGLRLVSKEFQHPAIQTKIEEHFGGFFHQCQPIGRQDSMQTLIWTSRSLDSFLKSFQIFKSKILKSKIKRLMSLVPLSCRSNLAGRK